MQIHEKSFRLILVPLDGSEFAEQALPTAVRIARRHSAMLHVVRVYVPVAGVYGERAVRYDKTLDRELMLQARKYLRGVITSLRTVDGVRASAALLEGWIDQAISRYAAAKGAGLIVMTTHGRGPLARFWLGSVADQLVRQAGCPVLFVRPQLQSSGASPDSIYRRVLIPLDGSPLAERVLEPIFALDKEIERQYTLLQVTTPVELNYGSAGGAITGLRQTIEDAQQRDREEDEHVREYLERLAGPWRARSFTVKTRVLPDNRPATAILEEASAHKIDLIALATHGRGGLKRLVLGSVADKLLRGAESAVLVYRPVSEAVDSVADRKETEQPS